MTKFIQSLFGLALLLSISGCFVMENTYSALPPGRWRAVLKLENSYITPNPKGKPLPEKVNMTYEDVPEGELPFTFDVVYENDSVFHLEIINGEERLLVPAKDILYGRSKHRARDTIRIDFPIYQSYLTASFAGNVIEGSWVVTTRENYAIPFKATHGKDYRFSSLINVPAANFGGKWACTFGLDQKETYPAVGEFKQKGNRLTGTFATETGDYRYLEGTILGDKAWLSCFDGSHAFLFEAKMKADSSIVGAFYSGKHHRETWDARRDPNAVLKNPDSLAKVLPGYEKVNFSLPNVSGKMISPDNPEYEGKVKILQIMGTWCPNCRDETEFLVNYLAEKKPEGLAVIALGFEKHADKDKANEALKTYQEHFGMSYELVHAGMSKKDEAAKVLHLDRVLAFPTMIFLDRQNRVRKIHTGFYGPATSQHQQFIQEFDEYLQALLSEK